MASVTRCQPPIESLRGTAGKEARSIPAPRAREVPDHCTDSVGKHMNGSRAALHLLQKTTLIAFADSTYDVAREPFGDALDCCIGAMNDVDHRAPRSSTVKTNKERHYRSSQTTFVQRRSMALWQVKATRPSSQSSRKSAFTSLDQSCPMTSQPRGNLTCRARHIVFPQRVPWTTEPWNPSQLRRKDTTS